MIVTAVSANLKMSKSLRNSIMDSLSRRKTFYKARAIEDEFWLGINKSIDCLDEENFFEKTIESVERWSRKYNASTGWFKPDGLIKKGGLPVSDFMAVLPNKILMIKRYESAGRDVIFAPVLAEGHLTYAMIASGEYIEIEC